MRNSLKRLVLVVVSVLLALTLLELGFRAARYIIRGPNSRAAIADTELGWVHNTARPVVVRKNACGEEVVTKPAPTPYLIRVPQHTTGTRVLFLGDSTTHGHEVSSGAAFYDVVEKAGQGRFSVWAAGVGAYGNFQEYLLLQKIYEEIRPAIVVWQLDMNDVRNNVRELDDSILNNTIQQRPYVDPASGAIEMGSPALRIFRVSDGAAFLFAHAVVLDNRFGLGIVDRIEQWMMPPADEMPALNDRGVRVLDYVVAEAARRYPATRFAGFSVSAEYDDQFGDIFRRHGGRYWTDFAGRVAAGAPRTDCSPNDNHWNVAGNRIAGELMSTLLSEM